MITCKCVVCGKSVDVDVTPEQVERHRLGEKAQKAFSNIEEDEREILISGMCSECYDIITDDDDQEENLTLQMYYN